MVCACLSLSPYKITAAARISCCEPLPQSLEETRGGRHEITADTDRVTSDKHQQLSSFRFSGRCGFRVALWLSRLKNTRYCEKDLSNCELVWQPLESTRYGKHRVARGDWSKEAQLGLGGVDVDHGGGGGFCLLRVGFSIVVTSFVLPDDSLLFLRATYH